MKILKKALIVILAIQVSGFLFLGCLLFYRFAWNITDWELSRMWVLITFIFLIAILFWIYRKKRFFAYALIIVSIVIIGTTFYEYDTSQKNNNFAYEWPSLQDTLHMPFTVGESGRLHLKATVNNITGLFIIDTGSDVCIVNEAIIQNPVETSEEYSLTDAQGIVQYKKHIIIDSFQVSGIRCEEVRFWPADSASWSTGGAFDGQEEVLGILGNTFLTNFVWDFDMVNHSVTVTRTAKSLKPMHNETALSFLPVNNHWMLPVAINGEEKMVLLDFGHTTPLRIEDSVSNGKKSIYGIGKENPGTAFMHTLTDSVQRGNVFSFLAENVSLGNQSFDSIVCYEKAYSSLIGMPFIWAFERVVLDYPQEKIYLMKKQTAPGKFDVRTVSHQYREGFKIENMHASSLGYFDIHTKYFADNMAPTLTESQDTVMAKYRIYGTARYWGRNLQDLDSIQCMDSVLLPNGKIKYAPFTIDTKNVNSY